MHRAEHIHLVLLGTEHFFENGIRENAKEPGDDLLPRFAVDTREKLRLEEAFRDGVELRDHVSKRPAVLHEIVEGKEGGPGDSKHRAGEVRKDDALLLGELGTQKRRKNIPVELQDAVKDFLPLGRFEILEPLQVGIEEVEGDRMGEIVRIDEEEAVLKRAAFGVEDVEPGQFRDEVALAVEEGEAEGFAGRAGQVFEDEELEALRFAVAAACHDMQVLEPGGARDRERERRRIESEKRGLAGYRADELVRRRVLFRELTDRFRAVLAARGLDVFGEPVAQVPKNRGRANVVTVEAANRGAEGFGRIVEVGEEWHPKQGRAAGIVGRSLERRGSFEQDIAEHLHNEAVEAVGVFEIVCGVPETLPQFHARENVFQGRLHGEFVRQRCHGGRVEERFAQIAEEFEEGRRVGKPLTERRVSRFVADRFPVGQSGSRRLSQPPHLAEEPERFAVFRGIARWPRPEQDMPEAHGLGLSAV